MSDLMTAEERALRREERRRRRQEEREREEREKMEAEQREEEMWVQMNLLASNNNNFICWDKASLMTKILSYYTVPLNIF